MIHLKIEQVGDEVAILFDDHAREILDIAIGDTLRLERTEGGLLAHIESQGGARRTFTGRIDKSSYAATI